MINCPIDLTSACVGDIFTWDEVSAIHRARHGVYQRNGSLISLLTDFGQINPCYPDVHGATSEVIEYTGSGRRGDQTLDVRNRALMDAIGTAIAVPLFCKRGVNRWEFLGLWQVAGAKYIFDQLHVRMVWKFTLVRG